MNIKALASFTGVLIWIYIFWGPVLLHPNDHMLSDSGDGIKSYTVYAGHIRNDSGYLDYSNMNYPYGQNHVFTDGQFLVSNVIKALSHFSPWFETHSIGIFNFLILFSFPMSAFFLSLIFTRLPLPGWFNVASSICIAILGPQIFRIGGHLTLSYACCIPFCWWLLIRFIESDKKWWNVILFTSVSTVLFFIHPYYTAILSLFVFFILLVWIVSKKTSFLKNKNQYLGYLFMSVLPLLLTQIFVVFTEHHTGRPLKPFGFWENFATFSTVFTPNSGPLSGFFKQLGINVDHWEGWSYIGLPTALIACFCIFRILRYAFRKKLFSIFHQSEPGWLVISSWASVFLLLYSMAFPFRLHMEFLLDWFSALRQFRALGRFAWVFFYVFSVYAFYISFKMYRYLRFKGLNAAAFTFIALLFSITTAEAWYQHDSMAENSNDNLNYFSQGLLPAEYQQLIHAVDSLKKDYQCLVPLPFYQIGSDNFTTKDPVNSIRTSMIVSYWCNYPLLANSAARTPILESKNILQFFSMPFLHKNLQADLPDKRSFLVLYTRDDLDLQETYWLSRSKKIWENNKFELWNLNYEDVFSSTEGAVWINFDAKKDSLLQLPGGWLSTRPGFVFSLSFDSLHSDTLKRGPGGFSGNSAYYNTLIDKQKFPFDADRDYILSYWYYNHGDGQNQTNLIISETDPENNTTEWTQFLSPVRSKNIDGDWSLVEQKFRPKNPHMLISVFFKEELHNNMNFWADELLLRPADADVYHINGLDSAGRPNRIIYNNYSFSR